MDCYPTSDQRKALLELAEALGSRKAALHRDEFVKFCLDLARRRGRIVTIAANCDPDAADADKRTIWFWAARVSA